MNQTNKKRISITQIMRALHRDIGFLVVGLIIIYSVSGLVLVFRGTGLLKLETVIEKSLAKNLDADGLKKGLKRKNLNIVTTEGDIVYYNNGTYNKATGAAIYTVRKQPEMILKSHKLHRADHKNSFFWVSILLSACLFFLVMSSLWMYKPNTKSFRRGVVLTVMGSILAASLLYFV